MARHFLYAAHEKRRTDVVVVAAAAVGVVLSIEMREASICDGLLSRLDDLPLLVFMEL